MKILEILTLVVGPIVFLMGIGTTAIFCVISFNEKSLQFAGIACGIALLIIGWLITRYAARSKGDSMLDIILGLFGY